MPSYQQAFHELRGALQPLYDTGEAAAIAKAVLEHLTGATYTQSLLSEGLPLEPEQEAALDRMRAELLQGRPVQYVIGYAWFMSWPFRVNDSVLIPRPETEELVRWIVSDRETIQRPFSLLDIGTGSGCIPISLQLALDQASVTACDISPAALTVARTNATRLGAKVDFRQLDFLGDPSGLPVSDVIVSNPPYIPASERATLHTNVREYEPATALFVPDEDPLLFYRAIASFGKMRLSPEGAVYCELHRDHAADTETLFREEGYRTELRPDLNGHPRMLKAVPR